MRSPLHSEDELRHYDREQKERQYSYDLTQRLTYFIIGAELIFCGYMLLNSGQFGPIKYSSTLFLLSGLAALFGVFWRFFYNQTYHDSAHEKVSSKIMSALQLVAYWLYVLLTIVFFISLLWVGYFHLSKISAKSSEPLTVEKNENSATSQQSGLNNTSKPTQ